MVDVAVIIGSKSDQELGDKAAKMLESFEVPYDLQVISAHRNPDKLAKYVKDSPAKVFVCIAGLAAALPGAFTHTAEIGRGEQLAHRPGYRPDHPLQVNLPAHPIPGEAALAVNHRQVSVSFSYKHIQGAHVSLFRRFPPGNR